MGSGGSTSNAVVSMATIPPERPYNGPRAQYQFTNTEVKIGAEISFSFTATPMVTSDVDSYYPLLAQQYAQGYRLISFYRIPGQMKRAGFLSASVLIPFMGIFCRYPDNPSREGWQLRIEKSVMHTQSKIVGMVMYAKNQGQVADTTHIIETIARATQNGGRLVCIEMTGQAGRSELRQAMRGRSPMMGVDVFFEVPSTHQTETYVYQSVNVPIEVTFKNGFQPRPIVNCDWMGHFATHLNQGWRLVEIFMDMTVDTEVSCCSAVSTQNSMWFFEKPTSRMNDPSPVYEGTVLDHMIEIRAGFTSSNSYTNFEPVFQEMGNRGWELACILETPEYFISGMTIHLMCKLFFQRPLRPT